MVSKKDELHVINQWDHSSLKLLYHEYFRSMTLFADKILRNVTEAEDVVQDVFLTIWQDAKKFDSIQLFRSYLYMCVHNECISQLRKRHLNTVSMEDHLFANQEDSIANEEMIIDLDDIMRQVLMAVEKLPEKQRKVLLLTLQGKTIAEIATIMNNSVGTIKKHKFRAISKLKEKLLTEVMLVLFFLIH